MRANAQGQPRMDAEMYLSRALEANRALEAEGQKQAAGGGCGGGSGGPDPLHRRRQQQGLGEG